MFFVQLYIYFILISLIYHMIVLISYCDCFNTKGKDNVDFDDYLVHNRLTWFWIFKI